MGYDLPDHSLLLPFPDIDAFSRFFLIMVFLKFTLTWIEFFRLTLSQTKSKDSFSASYLPLIKLTDSEGRSNNSVGFSSLN